MNYHNHPQRTILGQIKVKQIRDKIVVFDTIRLSTGIKGGKRKGKMEDLRAKLVNPFRRVPTQE